MIYSSWDIEQNILKLVILGHFLPFYPIQTPKIKILKMKKFAGDIIIYHMMHGSSNMECNRQNFLSLSLWTIFCPFPPSPLNFEKRPTAKKCCCIWKLWWQNINYGSKICCHVLGLRQQNLIGLFHQICCVEMVMKQKVHTFYINKY